MPPVTILEDATRAITQGFNETPPVGSGGRPYSVTCLVKQVLF